MTRGRYRAVLRDVPESELVGDQTDLVSGLVVPQSGFFQSIPRYGNVCIRRIPSQANVIRLSGFLEFVDRVAPFLVSRVLFERHSWPFPTEALAPWHKAS